MQHGVSAFLSTTEVQAFSEQRTPGSMGPQRSSGKWGGGGNSQLALQDWETAKGEGAWRLSIFWPAPNPERTAIVTIGR